MLIVDGVLVKVTPREAKGHFVIPDSVTSIGESAFEGCTGLTGVTIGNGVKSIGDLAFYRCYGLTNVTIPDSVTSIGESAFYGCSGLTSVTIPNSVTNIGSYAFYGCTGLTSVTIPNSVTSIGGGAFRYCSGLTSVTIPDSVTSIGWEAFYSCPDAVFEIVGGVKYIGKWAIVASNTSITRVTLRDGTVGIADNAFSGCKGLTSVTIPNSVTSMGERAFSGCTKLKTKSANFKAFEITPSGKLKCLDKTYKERHKSFAKGDLKLCKNGIHYCTNLFENFNYYCGELDKDIAIYECDVSDENIGEEGTSKRCARWIIPRKRLYREDVIRILNGGE